MSCHCRGLRLQIAFALLPTLLTVGVAQAQQAARAQDSRSRNQQFDFSLTGGASWSSNIDQVAADEESGAIGRAGVQLRFERESRRIDADVDMNLMYEHYLEGSFDDEVVGGLDATLNLSLVPDRLSWFVQENFGQVTSDPFGADTPGNRENINYLTTGPDLIVRLGTSTSLLLSGRYSDTRYETSDLDMQQYGGALALTRDVSGISTLSVIAEANRYEFDDPDFNTDYDRYQGYLRYQVRGGRTELNVDGGYTWIDIEEENSGGLLARVSLIRRMTRSSTLTFRAGSESSDSGGLFRDRQSLQGVDLATSNVVVTDDPFELRFGALEYDFSRNRTGFGVRVRHAKELYESSTEFDREITNWGSYFNRRMSPTTQLRFFADYEREKFKSLDFDADVLSVGTGLDWSMGRTLTLLLQYEYIERKSADASTEYDENQVSLLLRWSPVRGQ